MLFKQMVIIQYMTFVRDTNVTGSPQDSFAGFMLQELTSGENGSYWLRRSGSVTARL